MSGAGELMLSDISDQRAYEREREAFRKHIIALKKKRRIHVGHIQTLVFENRETVRFQVQEVARVEKIISDQGIATELRMYNPLISRPGKLSATLFIELTSQSQMRNWLPRLVGIEQTYELHIGQGSEAVVLPSQVDPQHQDALTRDRTTASVHYLWWEVSSDLVDDLEAGPVTIVCTHPEYQAETPVSQATRSSLAGDLRE